MEHRSSKGVSTYLEAFVLLGAVTAGAVLVGAASGLYGGAAQGAALSVPDASVTQGAGGAVERVEVSNTGTIPYSSFTVATQGIPSAQYYVTLTNAATGGSMTASPSSGSNPSSVTENVDVDPGQSVVFSMFVLSGTEFTLGSGYSVTVTTQPAAQQQVFVVVLSP